MSLAGVTGADTERVDRVLLVVTTLVCIRGQIMSMWTQYETDGEYGLVDR